MKNFKKRILVLQVGGWGVGLTPRYWENYKLSNRPTIGLEIELNNDDDNRYEIERQYLAHETFNVSQNRLMK